MFAKANRWIGLVLGTLWLVLMVSGCSETDSSVSVNSNGAAVVKVGPPSFLQIRTIDPDDLRLEVTINGTEVVMTRQGQNWSGSATADKFSSIILRVEWSEEQINGSELLLATAFNQQNNIASAIDFSVTESSYVSMGEGFDADNDGISNLRELKQGLDPLVPNGSTDDVEADVKILPSGNTTIIDGRHIMGDTFWSFATYIDVKGGALAIDNMIRDDSVDIEEDPNPGYRWAAIHDEEFLTLFVSGKVRNGSTILVNGDSPGLSYFNDDSLEIYFDGDLSQGREGYDKVDDLLINIPLARGVAPMLFENNSSATDKRIYRGNSVMNDVEFDVLNPANVEFATCFCGGTERVTWEVRINLEAAKIKVDKTFGFEVQINRDDNGGERDSKWAWAKPARLPGQSSNESDATWRFPVHMGKIKLVPFPPE